MSRTERGRRFAAATCQDYKRMSLAAAVFTMLFCSITIGLLVNDLIDISGFLNSWQTTDHGRQKASRDVQNDTQAGDENGVKQQMHNATVTKVMYTALICELILLTISSIALLKGVYQKKQSLIMAWMMIVIATIVYSGAVIIRDYNLQGDTSEVYAKSIMYIIFVVSELAFFKHVARAFREARRSLSLRVRSGVAVFDPRHPDSAIFNISGNMEPPDPNTLFKLPTYEEVTAETNTDGEGSTPDSRGKLPSYEPPAYEP